MQQSMEKTIELFSNSIVGIRVGNVSSSLIDTVKIPNHGQMTPLRHLSMTGKQGHSITIDPYDPSLVQTISKCLEAAGFSAYVFSKTRVVVSIPPPSGEEREAVIVHLKKMAEECKISIRNIRKNYRQKLSKEEQKSDKEIQKITDLCIIEVDQIVAGKVKSL